MSLAYSITLAKMWAIYFGVITVWLVLYRKVMDNYMRDLMYHKMALFAVSILTLILGIILIVTHNIWVNDWRVVLTIVSWFVFIKGCILLLGNSQCLTWLLEHITIKKLFPFQFLMSVGFLLFFTYYGFYLN